MQKMPKIKSFNVYVKLVSCFSFLHYKLFLKYAFLCFKVKLQELILLILESVKVLQKVTYLYKSVLK